MKYRLLLLTVFLLSCSRADEAPMSQALPMEESEMKADKDMAFGGAAAPKSAPARAGRKMKKGGLREGLSGMVGNAEMDGAEEAPPDADDEAPADEEAPATRAWFPETFLFEPLVQTDASGRATVDVKVPDRLTTWRVLALAHSKEGAQAGTVTTFLGTLPVYVDPNVPKRLLVGDLIDIPIQVVNSTDASVSGRIDVKVEGAALVSAAGALTVPSGGSLVRYVRVRANEPGDAKVSARFGKYDAVERTFEVRPRGRPVQTEKGGTLAAPRKFSLKIPKNADPRTTQVRLVVFPGALSVLRTELASASSRGGVVEDAYTLLLAGRAPELLSALGGKADPEQLRKMRIVATQRALSHARSPNPATATVLTEAALVHGDEPVLSRLGERLASQLASAQRPDGTFQGGSGWTLQRLLVATADGVRAVRASTDDPAAARRAKGVTIRANGAFERHTRRVDDPYTAAAIVASGAVDGPIAESLRARVREAIVERGDGARVLKVPKGVVRADGVRPSEVEATALAVLALADDSASAELLPDLGAAILAGYRSWRGFGDGRTNLVALRAVLRVFAEPIPDNVKITLSRGNETIITGALDPKNKDRRSAFTARVPQNSRGEWHLVAQPPVPGLGYNLTVESYVPWPVSGRGDLALNIDVAKNARVGRTVAIETRVAGPPGVRVEVAHGLPVGVRPVKEDLSRAVLAGTIESWTFDEGRLNVTFKIPPGDAPITYRVIPTFAGDLYAPASSVTVVGRGDPLHVPPSKWKVAR